MAALSVPYSPTPSVEPVGGTSGGMNIQASPNAFGAQIGQSVEKVGNSLEEFGQAQAHLTNELYANDTSIDGMKGLGAIYGKYATLEGRAAVDALPQFQKDVIDHYHATLAAAPNQSSKELVSQSMRMLTDRYLGYAQGHADTEFKRWSDQSAIGRSNELGNQAALAVNYPDTMDSLLRAGADERRKLGEQKGWDADAINADISKYNGGILRDIIDQKALEDPEGAQKLFEKYGPQMDAASRLNIARTLHPKILDLQANQISNAAFNKYGNNRFGFQPEVEDAIKKASDATGVDQQTLRTFARIESSGNPSASTGSYHGLYQLSKQEFQKHADWDAHIEDPYANALAGARKLSAESTQFEAKYGRSPDAGELYLIHQQGWGGFQAQMARPNLPAWRNMAATAEGNVKGQGWAKQAIWGNIPNDMKHLFPGGVDTVTGNDFMNLWKAKVQHFSNPGDDQNFGLPDKSAVLKDVMDATNGNPELQRHAITKINQIYSQHRTETASDREVLRNQLPNYTEQALNGVEGIQFPEEKIRQVYEPTQAQILIDNFNNAQRVGQTLSGLQWASPEELAQAEQDLNSGRGYLSEALKSHTRYGTTGAGMTDADPNAVSDYGKLQKTAIARFNTIKANRDRMLFGAGNDPGDAAQYVASNPTVKAAGAAFQAKPDDPGTFQAYAAATKATQMQLGVPDEGVRVLTKQGAQNLAGQIMDSAVDPAAQIRKIQQQAGPYWPNVQRDLVQLGGLSPVYQNMAALQSPTDASLMSRWVREMKDVGKGKESQGDDVHAANLFGGGDPGKKQVNTIQTTIRGSSEVTQFLNSLRDSGFSTEARLNMMKSMDTLAFARKAFLNDDNAADYAINAFTSQYKYMPSGAYVPGKVYDTVRNNAEMTLNTIKAGDLQIPRVVHSLETIRNNAGGEKSGHTESDRYVDMLRANPQWITSPNGDGLMIKDWMGRIVRGKNGQPFKLPFNAPLMANDTNQTAFGQL